MAFGAPAAPPAAALTGSAAKPLPPTAVAEGRAKLVKLLGSYGPAFISDSGLLAGPGATKPERKPPPGVILGAAREIVSAEHWKPLSCAVALEPQPQ